MGEGVDPRPPAAKVVTLVCAAGARNTHQSVTRLVAGKLTTCCYTVRHRHRD